MGGLQIILSGKAHPADHPAKEKIQQVIELTRQLCSDELKIVYLEDYDWSLGALLTGGVDLWLNTPKRPHEASGTSGMKAALNGVPSLRSSTAGGLKDGTKASPDGRSATTMMRFTRLTPSTSVWSR
jgi:glucan phosphorylase